MLVMHALVLLPLKLSFPAVAFLLALARYCHLLELEVANDKSKLEMANVEGQMQPLEQIGDKEPAKTEDLFDLLSAEYASSSNRNLAPAPEQQKLSQLCRRSVARLRIPTVEDDMKADNNKNNTDVSSVRSGNHL